MAADRTFFGPLSWSAQQQRAPDVPAQAQSAPPSSAEPTFRLLKRNLFKQDGSFYGADAFRIDPKDNAACYTIVSEQRYRLALTSTSSEDHAKWAGVQIRACLRYDTGQMVRCKREAREGSSPEGAEPNPRDFPFVYFSDARPSPESRVEIEGEMTDGGDASFTFAMAATSFLHGRRWFTLDVTCNGASRGLAIRGKIKMYVKARGSSESKKMMVDGATRYPLMLPGEPDPASMEPAPGGPDAPCIISGKKRKQLEQLKPTKVPTGPFQSAAEGRPRGPDPGELVLLEGGRVVQAEGEGPAWPALSIPQQLQMALAQQQAQLAAQRQLQAQLQRQVAIAAAAQQVQAAAQLAQQAQGSGSSSAPQPLAQAAAAAVAAAAAQKRQRKAAQRAQAEAQSQAAAFEAQAQAQAQAMYRQQLSAAVAAGAAPRGMLALAPPGLPGAFALPSAYYAVPVGSVPPAALGFQPVLALQQAPAEAPQGRRAALEYSEAQAQAAAAAAAAAVASGGAHHMLPFLLPTGGNVFWGPPGDGSGP